MNLKEVFDRAYSSEEATFGAIPSEELRDYIIANHLCGDALDIGCGNGRDALFLASVGFNVTAIDISGVALQKLMKFAKLRKLEKKIKPINCDARYWHYPYNAFDLVTSATCLDHMPKKDHKPLLEKIVQSLKDGGILFLEVHTIDDPGFRNTNGKSEYSFLIQYYFRHNELLRLVEPTFYIIRYEEKIEEDKDHGKLHKHGFANVLARKISLDATELE